MAFNAIIARAHIQNFTDVDNSSLEPHWGYVDRIIPCTSDAGSCAYLDVVYHSHDLSMLYTGIFWGLLLGLLFFWAVGRRLFPSRKADDTITSPSTKIESQEGTPIGGLEKLRRTISAFSRRYLSPDSAPSFLGHTTRLQVLVLLILGAYLTVFTFIGIVYQTWVTPVKSSPGYYNTRTSLGPFADRIGVLAYALTPLSVLLASRESLLSVITGLPYQSFMFLHRWLGYIIVIQSLVHTIGWVVVEAKLYQPQPDVWNSLIAELYIIWGVVAMVLLFALYLLATPWGIRLTGYEFFRKSHYVLAMVYIGAIIAHWQNLQCFLVPGLALWFLDRAGRFVRTAMLHYSYLPNGKWGFAPAEASVTHWSDPDNGDVIRLDFDHVQQAWAVGQHFYLCFSESSLWQSHPMTPLSLPVADGFGRVRHSYVIRAKGGETKKIAQIAVKKLAALGNTTSEKAAGGVTTSVVLQGPYGTDMVDGLTSETNVLCVAGGTGITFVLPVLLKLVQEKAVSASRKIELVWAVRRDQDVEWVKQELDEIKKCSHGINVHVYVTRETEHRSTGTENSNTVPSSGEDKNETTAAVSSAEEEEGDDVAGGCDCNDVTHHHASNVEVPAARRPHLDEAVRRFVGATARGSTIVFASGPGGMIGDLRRVVAGCNEGGRVWRGNGRFDVRLVCDDRLEY